MRQAWGQWGNPAGDLNLPDIDWETNSIQGNSYLRSVKRLFLDKINDLGVHQANHEPTREEAIFDMFLTNRPHLITKITVIPRLGDHDTLRHWARSSRILALKKWLLLLLLLSSLQTVASKHQMWSQLQERWASVRRPTAKPSVNTPSRIFRINTGHGRWQKAAKRRNPGTDIASAGM